MKPDWKLINFKNVVIQSFHLKTDNTIKDEKAE